MIGLTYIRKLFNLSMEDLSQKLGVSKQTVSKWESKKIKIADERLEQMIEIFSLPIEHFQKEINDIDKLTIQKIKIDNELGVIDSDEKIKQSLRVEELEYEIKDRKNIMTLGALYDNVTNGEAEDITDTLETFLDVYKATKASDLNLGSLLCSVGKYLKIEGYENSVDPGFLVIDSLEKYYGKLDKFEARLFELLNYRKQIEEEYENDKDNPSSNA